METIEFKMMEAIDANPMLLPIIFLFAITTIAVFWDSKKKGKIKPWKMAPDHIPVLGHIHLVAGGGFRNLPQTVEKWADKYAVQPDQPGCMEINMAGRRFLVICREDRYTELLKYRVPGKIERLSYSVAAVESVGAGGVFSATGNTWKEERKHVSANLNHSNVQAALATFQDMTKRLLAKWDTTKESIVSPVEDLGLVASDTIARVALDRDFDFLRNPDSRVAADVGRIVEASMVRALSPVPYWHIPFIGQYLDGYGFAIYRLQKVLNDIIQEQESAKTEAVVEDTDKGKKSYLGKIVGLAHSDKNQIERHRLTGNVITLFLAAVDTISKSLTHSLHVLAKDQNLQRELRKDVDQLTQNGDKVLDFTSLDDVFTKLPRIKSFMHEMHRRISGPMINVTTTAEIPFLGTTLPKGTNIAFMAKYISSNTVCPSKLVPMGPNGEPPHEFCPARYLVRQEDGSLACPNPDRNGGAFGAFGFGLRSCPGRAYGEAVSFTILASLLQNYEWELPPNHPVSDKLLFDFIYMPEFGVKIKLTPRQASAS